MNEAYEDDQEFLNGSEATEGELQLLEATALEHLSEVPVYYERTCEFNIHSRDEAGLWLMTVSTQEEEADPENGSWVVIELDDVYAEEELFRVRFNKQNFIDFLSDDNIDEQYFVRAHWALDVVCRDPTWQPEIRQLAERVQKLVERSKGQSAPEELWVLNSEQHLVEIARQLVEDQTDEAQRQRMVTLVVDEDSELELSTEQLISFTDDPYAPQVSEKLLYITYRDNWRGYEWHYLNSGVSRMLDSEVLYHDGAEIEMVDEPRLFPDEPYQKDVQLLLRAFSKAEARSKP